jgi:hypothetical protein
VNRLLNQKRFLTAIVLTAVVGACILMVSSRGPDQLLDAVRACDAPRLAGLLGRGIDPNITTAIPGKIPRDGVSALSLAALKDCDQAASLLLKYGGDANLKDSRGETALHHAAARGNVYMVDLLLGAGARPNESSSQHETPLSVAAARGHALVVRRLIDAGANVDGVGLEGFTPIELATRLRHYEVVLALLAAGAGVEAGSPGERATIEAASDDDSQIMRLLLQHGASAIVSDGTTCPLYRAAANGSVATTRTLLGSIDSGPESIKMVRRALELARDRKGTRYEATASELAAWLARVPGASRTATP